MKFLQGDIAYFELELYVNSALKIPPVNKNVHNKAFSTKVSHSKLVHLIVPHETQSNVIA